MMISFKTVYVAVHYLASPELSAKSLGLRQWNGINLLMLNHVIGGHMTVECSPWLSWSYPWHWCYCLLCPCVSGMLLLWPKPTPGNHIALFSVHMIYLLPPVLLSNHCLGAVIEYLRIITSTWKKVDHVTNRVV